MSLRDRHAAMMGRVLSTLLALGSCAPRAHADDRSTPPPLFVRLAPSARERSQARADQLARKLAATLRALASVEHAHVTLDLPAASEQPLDRPRELAHATITLRAPTPEPTLERDVTRLFHGFAPELRDAHLTLVLERPARGREVPELAQIGPFQVAASSREPLRWTFALSLVTHAALALLLLWRLRTGRPRQRKVDRHDHQASRS